MHRFGGIQRCPWCRQIAQSGTGWSFERLDTSGPFDLLTCGVCQGTSVWIFGMGMHAIGPLAPPPPDSTFPNRLAEHRIAWVPDADRLTSRDPDLDLEALEEAQLVALGFYKAAMRRGGDHEAKAWEAILVASGYGWPASPKEMRGG